MRAKQILVSLAAIFSLFVSAVSACACSHHQPVKQVTETSCHGASHDEAAMITVETEVDSDIFEAACYCFVKTPAPAIVAKTDKKKSSIEKAAAEFEQWFTEITPMSVNDRESVVFFDPSAPSFESRLLYSLPSRAPPRL